MQSAESWVAEKLRGGDHVSRGEKEKGGFAGDSTQLPLLATGGFLTPQAATPEGLGAAAIRTLRPTPLGVVGAVAVLALGAGLALLASRGGKPNPSAGAITTLTAADGSSVTVVHDGAGGAITMALPAAEAARILAASDPAPHSLANPSPLSAGTSSPVNSPVNLIYPQILGLSQALTEGRELDEIIAKGTRTVDLRLMNGEGRVGDYVLAFQDAPHQVILKFERINLDGSGPTVSLVKMQSGLYVVITVDPSGNVINQTEVIPHPTRRLLASTIMKHIDHARKKSVVGME